MPSMNEAFRIENIPPYILESLERYRDHGIPTGDCLRAFLVGDLYQAVLRADENTLKALPAIVAWISTKLPMGWGSEQNVDEWIELCASGRAASEVVE